MGWGNLGYISNTIDPFEIGVRSDGIDAQSIYASLEASLGQYTLNLLYGTSYSLDEERGEKVRQNEVDLTLEAQISDTLRTYVGFYNTHLQAQSYKASAGMFYSF